MVTRVFIVDVIYHIPPGDVNIYFRFFRHFCSLGGSACIGQQNLSNPSSTVSRMGDADNQRLAATNKSLARHFPDGGVSGDFLNDRRKSDLGDPVTIHPVASRTLECQQGDHQDSGVVYLVLLSS